MSPAEAPRSASPAIDRGSDKGSEPARPSVIAIDGPAASGKSSVGMRLANHLGYGFLDTGAMYRAVTLAALERGVPVDDRGKVEALADALDLEIVAPHVDDGRQYTVLADGTDVTWEIRAGKVDAHVSQVSAYPGVRRALSERQREIGSRGRIVMVGRDIGTVVLPDADLKIYLKATPQERARRRVAQLDQRGGQASYEVILAEMLRRDAFDSEREVAPLKPADDAAVLDTDGMSEGETVEACISLVEGWAPPPARG